MKEIQEITALETFSLRHSVLRKGKAIETCYFEGDNLASTKHFGLFIDEKLTAVASIYKNKNVIFINNNQFQIRGMAVLKNFQKKGLGQELLVHCEQIVKSQKGEIVWFNARENAVNFYTKLGYEIIGTLFEIENVGPHYIMKKTIVTAYE